MDKFDYKKQDIVDALLKVGRHQKQNVFSHSNLGFFGKLKDASDRDSYCAAFKEAFFEVIGTEGTLVVPTFSYSYCWNKIYNKDNTPSTCGIFSEFIRNDPNSLRSDDPNFSYTSIGKNAEYFTKDCPPNPFGKESFWERCLLKNGIVCNLNFDAAATLTHFVEREVKVPYRFDKSFEGKSFVNGKLQKRIFYHFVRDDNNPEVYPDFTKFDKKAKQLGLARVANLGKGQAVCISVKDSYGLIKKEIVKNPNFLIKGSFKVKNTQ